LAVGGKSILALYDDRHVEQSPVVIASHGNWTSLAFDGAGQSLAAGSSTGEVHIWNLDDLMSRVLLDGKSNVDPEDSSNGEAIAALSFSRDNTALAVAAQGTDVLILDPQTGAVRQRIVVGMADAAKLSPTEDMLATTTADHRVELWHWPSAKRLWQSDKYADRPGWVVFSPDGRLVLAETGDRTVRLFDRSTGDIVRELGQHREAILRMAMSPDERTIATKDSAGRLNFWHAASGQLLYSLPSTRTGGYQEVVFSPDGHWLAFRSATDEVELVPLHP
jgi:WD40 repeat protein